MEMKDFSKKTIVEFLNDKNDKKIEDCIYRLWFYTKIKNLVEGVSPTFPTKYELRKTKRPSTPYK